MEQYRERINKLLQQGAAGGRIHKPCPTLASAAPDVQADGGGIAAASADTGDAITLD